jgi:Kef-type K+ transport system membrane component KefB
MPSMMASSSPPSPVGRQHMSSDDENTIAIAALIGCSTYSSTSMQQEPRQARSTMTMLKTTRTKLKTSAQRTVSSILLVCLLSICGSHHGHWTAEAWQSCLTSTSSSWRSRQSLPSSLSSSSSSSSFRITSYSTASYSRIQHQQSYQQQQNHHCHLHKKFKSSSSSRLSALADFTILSDFVQAATTYFHHFTPEAVTTSTVSNVDMVSNGIHHATGGGEGGFFEAMTSSVATHLSSSTTTLATTATATPAPTASIPMESADEASLLLQQAGEAALAELGRDVLTFLAVSVIVVPLSQWLKVTPVLGFLVVGCLLGPNCLGVFANSEANLELGDFGILFLLFSEGLNLSPDRLGALRQFSGYGLFQIMASMMLFFFGILWGGPLVINYIAPVLHMDDFVVQIFSSPAEAFCIAAAGALSSSAFIFPVIKAKKWEDRPEGIAALSILLLQDVAVAPLLVILPIIAGAGPQTWSEVAILAAKATVGFGAVLTAGSFVIRYVFDVVAAARSTETFVAAALLVALGMGQVAEFLGLSATTGAFAAGVLLASNRYRAQIKADIRPFEGK